MALQMDFWNLVPSKHKKVLDGGLRYRGNSRNKSIRPLAAAKPRPTTTLSTASRKGSAPEAPAPKPGEAVASEPTGPSFMMALQEQLGLKLGTTKGPVEFLVIDRIERPSAN